MLQSPPFITQAKDPHPSFSFLSIFFFPFPFFSSLHTTPLQDKKNRTGSSKTMSSLPSASPSLMPKKEHHHQSNVERGAAAAQRSTPSGSQNARATEKKPVLQKPAPQVTARYYVMKSHSQHDIDISSEFLIQPNFSFVLFGVVFVLLFPAPIDEPFSPPLA